MLGLLPQNSGKIVIDQIPLGPATMGTWRSRIAAVMQDDYLLSGTLSENISFFDPQPNERRIEQACRLACIHEDIVVRNEGYDVSPYSPISRLFRDQKILEIGEGTNEVQRMVIAREILRNAFHHAHASRIEAEIRYDRGMFRLRIRDDGKGIDSSVLKEGTRTGHWGLPGMHERAKGIGGRLKIWSEPGAGTEAELTVSARTPRRSAARSAVLYNCGRKSTTELSLYLLVELSRVIASIHFFCGL